MIDPINLHALADGELTPEQESAVRELLAQSSAAEAELAAIVTVKRLVRERIAPVDCGVQWKACRVRLDELDRVRRIERVVSVRLAWGLSGIFFAAILGAGLMHRGTDSSNATPADVAHMIMTLQPAHDAGPKTSKEVNRTVDELFKLAQIVIDPNRMVVVDASYGQLDGREIREFHLRDASGDLALVVVPDVVQIEGMGVMRRDHSFKLGHVGSLNSVAWTDGKNTLIVVADRPYEDLATIASGLNR